jgi:hypothetical protein
MTERSRQCLLKSKPLVLQHPLCGCER